MDKYNYETGQDTADIKRAMPDRNGVEVNIGNNVILFDTKLHGTNNVLANLFERLNGSVGRVDRMFLPEFENFSEPIAKVVFADKTVLMCLGSEIDKTDQLLTTADECKGVAMDPRKSHFVNDNQQNQLGLFGAVNIVNNQMINAEVD